ncbi:HD-GYP domain-containing protein [Vibrio algarum]|uniref:HD domain-containing protein n=1 Tax=Vibrio algarum TaxID=3020714 RepID=A0ABT4YQD7_9VIBR|nr:HD domain-containing phosphohydrolase [Vibrio sp. KJ40-1]MDB1123770.1 HD domain-containing protein [Vibrio sp. KJ40-1]
MYKPQYQFTNTLVNYSVAGIIFGTYGGRVCPMLETLSGTEIGSHVALTFLALYITRHLLSTRGHFPFNGQLSKLDPLLFFIFSFPLAGFYNLSYDFPLDSNLKVVFGMTLFGFLSGTILELLDKNRYVRSDQFVTSLTGERRSIVKQMISMFTLVIIALTISLTMIQVKDIYWLEHNPERLLDGTGRISVIKEFIYVSSVLMLYSATIIVCWTKLLKQIFDSQEVALEKVSAGEVNVRVPIFEHDELGSVASLTNEMLDSLNSTREEVENTRDVAIVSLSALAETRDNETGAHILRTQEYVKALALNLSSVSEYKEILSPSYIDILHKSAPLHDMGKVGIPDNVLLKPGKLTEEEFEVMKQHPQIGADALSFAEEQMGPCSFLNVAKEISLTHHEKWDGSGYPKQLSGKNIPISGRLMALADVYDALISKRVYKPAFTHEKAKSIILEGSGSHFDPQVVEAFLSVETEFIDIATRLKDKNH